MAQNFSKARNTELSTFLYIKNSLDANWSGITTVKGFPDSDKPVIPCVAITLETELSNRIEIGSRQMDDVYNFSIDIFAKSHAQRLDLANYIKNKLLEDWVYYTFANQSGSNETVESIASGKVQFIDLIQNAKIEFGEDVEFYDRYRHIISFNVRVAS